MSMIRVRVDEQPPRVVKIGGQGPQGPQGEPGFGSLAVTSPIVNAGTSLAAQLRFDGKAFIYKQLAAIPEAIITGAITLDSNGVISTASVVWPDGNTGTFTVTAKDSTSGAINAYTVTWNGSPATTYTQPAMTRDAATGAVMNRPAITVA